MKITDLYRAIENAESTFAKIRKKYPRIRASLVLLCDGFQMPINSSLDALLDVEDVDFFIENEALLTAWNLLDAIWDLKDKKHDLYHQEIKSTESNISIMYERYRSLIPILELRPTVEVTLLWDEIDYEINAQLRSDKELIDVSRTPQLGGIKISLGTIESLSQLLDPK